MTTLQPLGWSAISCYPPAFWGWFAPLVAGWPTILRTILTVSTVFIRGGEARDVDRTVRKRENSDIGLPGLDFAAQAYCPKCRYAGLTHAPIFAPSVIYQNLSRAWSSSTVAAVVMPGRGNAGHITQALAGMPGRRVVTVHDESAPSELLIRSKSLDQPARPVCLASPDGRKMRLL
jgi:N-acetyl-gamma-glutamyl-phosphate reductase